MDYIILIFTIILLFCICKRFNNVEKFSQLNFSNNLRNNIQRPRNQERTIDNFEIKKNKLKKKR